MQVLPYLDEKDASLEVLKILWGASARRQGLPFGLRVEDVPAAKHIGVTDEQVAAIEN